MSGIAAFINISSEDMLHAREIVTSMLVSIGHRGEGGYVLKGSAQAVLGCRRLIFQDNKQQLLSNEVEQKTTFAVLDGAIYNRQELRAELEALGCQFHSPFDEEIVAYGYEIWGEKLVEHLDGMFVFIVYSASRQQFLAARDPLGIKPLYYLIKDGAGIFLASEMKALLPAEEIATLPPGHILTSNGVQPYFQLPKQVHSLEADEKSIQVTFKELLSKAVEKQVQVDGSIGVMLSGGLDSTVLLHLARQFHPNVIAFTVGFKGAEDVEVARRYCEETGVNQEIVFLQQNELVQGLPYAAFVGEFFEPINTMDTCTVSPAFCRAQELGIKVMLCGDGSDELLAGYDFFRTYPDPHYLMWYRLNNNHRTDLQRIDRSSLHFGVEARLPFFDLAFLQYAYRVPFSMKLRGEVDKWILREAFRGELPDYITQRPKIRLPDGSGVQTLLLDYARQQKCEVSSHLLARLGIDPADGAMIYFLAQYLKWGYPPPTERYKRSGLDYSENGYFTFVTSVSYGH